MALHKEEVTVHQAATSTDDTDSRGNPIIIPGVDIELAGCNVQPVGTEETIGDPTPVTSRWRVSTSKGDLHDEIREHDTVTWRGRDFDVLGDVQTWYGIRAHTEFIIKRTEG